MTTIGAVAKISANRWQTSDMWLCAYLRSQGYKISESKMAERRVVFFFEPSEDIESAVKSFFNREAMVDAMTYKAMLNEVRDMVTQIERGGTMGGKRHDKRD